MGLDVSQRSELEHRLDYLCDDVHRRYSKIDKSYFRGFLAALYEMEVLTQADVEMWIERMNSSY